ncbi:MAG: mechanosensitive ion channel family protein [Verrucomicrobiales bacterium]
MAIELKSALAVIAMLAAHRLLLGGKEGASLGAAFDDLLANHFSGASLVISGISGIPDPVAVLDQIAGSVASESVKKPEGDLASAGRHFADRVPVRPNLIRRRRRGGEAADPIGGELGSSRRARPCHI